MIPVLEFAKPIENWQKIWKKYFDEGMNYKPDLNLYPFKFANRMNSPQKLKILEMGVGSAEVFRFFKDNGHEVIGVDFEPDVIAAVKEKFPEYDVRVGNVLKADFPDNSFDLITMFGVIHYLTNEAQIRKAFSEMFRVQKNGGHILLSVSCENIVIKILNKINKLKAKILNNEIICVGMALNKTDIISIMTEAGFNNIRLEEYTKKYNFTTIYKRALFGKRKIFYTITKRNKVLNCFAKIPIKIIVRLFPASFTTYYIVTAQKTETKS